MRVNPSRSGAQPSTGTGADRSGVSGSGPVPAVVSVLSALVAAMGEDELFRDPFAEFAPSRR